MSENKQKISLIALSSIPITMTLGNSMLIPILPHIGKKLHVSSFQVSMIITVYAVCAILLTPVAGYLSDRFGRKNVIIPSLVIAAVGGIIAGVAACFFKGQLSYWIILLGRFLQGIGASGCFPIVIPLVGDLFKKEDAVSKGLGMIETSNTIGKVVSPIAGSALAMWLWYAPFFAVPVMCVVSFVLVLFFIKAPKSANSSSTVKQFILSIKKILKQKGTWLYPLFFIGGICMFIIFGVLFYLSEVLESKYALTGVWKGFVLAIPLAILSLGSYASGKAIGQNKLRMKWIGFIGLLVATISLLIIAWLVNIIAILCFITVACAGIGMTLPCLDSLITESIDEEHRGTTTSLFSSMRFLGVSVGPPFTAFLQTKGQLVLFIALAVIVGIGSIMMLLRVKPEPDKSAQC